MTETRQLAVEAVRSLDDRDRQPIVTSDLPFLRFEQIGESRETSESDPGLVLVTTRYTVRFATEPPAEGFGGQVTVTDPWTDGRTLTWKVHGEANPPLIVRPARLVLLLDQQGRAAEAPRFLARATPGLGRLQAEAEGDISPLAVEEVGRTEENGFQTFEVRWRAEPPAQEAVHNIIVRPVAADSPSRILPVLVRTARSKP